MRLAFVLFSLVFICAAYAQEQEKKLLDRLMRPDMSLRNEADGKQFAGAGNQTITKKAATKSFFVRQRKAEKGFWNTRQVSTTEFATQDSRDAKKLANFSTRTQIAKANTPYGTTTYGDVRTARDATRTVATSDYPGNRPFLEKGKSQKSLDARHEPMTIDEVRELLNKNK